METYDLTRRRGALYSLVRALRRFPLPAAFIVLFTLRYVMFSLGGTEDPPLADRVTLYYLASAALLATVTAVWGETVRSRRIKYGVTLATQFLWLGNAAYLFTRETVSWADCTGNAATVALFVAALAGLPYLRGHRELAFRRFCSRLVFSGIAALLTGGCFAVGSAFLLDSFGTLFGIDVSWKAYAVCMAVFLFCGTPLVFLSRMPSPASHDQEQNAVGPLTRYAVRYVLNPLLCVYAVLLYAYGTYILFSWELPNGWVSGLVSTLMGGLVLAVYLLLPTRTGDGWSRDDFVARYGPVLMLPLLVLMSIGIGRRLFDYGLTVRRLYLLIFNLWCYAACAYLLIHRARRIRWLLLSPVIPLFLVSVGPWSVANITRHVLAHEVERVLRSSGMAAVPLDEEDYRHTLESLPGSTARYVNDKLIYLADTYGRESVDAFILPEVELSKRVRWDETSRNVERRYIRFRRYAYDKIRPGRQAILPGNYSQVFPIDGTYSVNPASLQQDTLRFSIPNGHTDGQERHTRFAIPLSAVFEAKTDSTASPLICPSIDGRACLVVDELDLNPVLNAPSEPELRLQGILLTARE